jgi:hypothetical protein
VTRGRVCNLLVQFAVTLWSKFRRTHNHILLSHLRLSQPGGPGLCIYIPQEQGGPIIPPGTGLPHCTSVRPITIIVHTQECFDVTIGLTLCHDFLSRLCRLHKFSISANGHLLSMVAFMLINWKL